MKKILIFILSCAIGSTIFSIEKVYQNIRRVKFAFSFPETKPFLKPKKIILWVTEDNGINWYKAEKFDIKRNDKGENFIEWEAPHDGDFGFLLSYELEGFKEVPKPSLFDLPQYIVSVDTKSPKVIYFKALYKSKKKGILTLKWKVVDKNFSYQGIQLLYKKNGDFQLINENLPEEGETTWWITDSSQKFLKFAIRAKDTAGNEVVKIISRKNSKFSPYPTPLLTAKKEKKKEERLEQSYLPPVKEKEIPVTPPITETKTDDRNIQIKTEEPQKTEIIEKPYKTETFAKVTSTAEQRVKRTIPVKIPLNIRGDKSSLSSILVYYTTDKGKNWTKYCEISPYEDSLTFYTEKEMLYGFYFVFKTKDGISFPEEPKPGDVPSLYRFIDITAPKLKLFTPHSDILIAGKIYKIGWKIYDKNLDMSHNKLSVSYDGGKKWFILAKSLPKKGKINFRTPPKNLEGTLLFKLEARDFVGLSSSVVSKLYTVRKYDFEISFTEKKIEQKDQTSKPYKKAHKKQTRFKKEFKAKEEKPKIDYSKIEETLKNAKIMISRGQYYEALQNLNQIIQQDLNNMEALSLIGYIHILQENYSEGIKVLSHLFTIDCSDFTNFYNLSIGLIKANNIFDSASKLIDFLKCVPPESLDKSKREKLEAIISILYKKSEILNDKNIKNRVEYAKNILKVSGIEAARKEK